MIIFFWVTLFFLAFVYIGYGLVIKFINCFKTENTFIDVQKNELPNVAVIIAAYNEELVMEEKLKNTLSLNYPKEKIMIYAITDGSTDRTNEIVKQFPVVKLLWLPERKGKTSALNRVMGEVKEEISIFTDANVMLNENAVLEMVKHYIKEDVGGVSGEKRISINGNSAASTEGIYWKYESFLKKEDSKLGTMVGAAGELFSIRSALFSNLSEDTLLDDFMISMSIVRKGYKIAYEKNAYAIEGPSLNIKEEYKRKVRISAGGLQSVLRLLDFLNPFKYKIISFQYFFHRFSRWIITPILIPLLFIVNVWLIQRGLFYFSLFILQIIFHSAALFGCIFEYSNKRFKYFYIPFYFNFMHYCLIIGWVNYLLGKQKVVWHKSIRSINGLKELV